MWIEDQGGIFTLTQSKRTFEVDMHAESCNAADGQS